MEEKSVPITLVAMDLDDTLLDERQLLSQRILATVRRVLDRGVAVTIATGRMYCSTLPFALELGLTLPLITYNGAMIRSPVSDEILLHRPVPADLAREVAFLYRERGWYLQKYVDDRLLVENLDENALFYADYAKVEAVSVGEEFFRMDVPPTKMLAMGNPEELSAMQAVLRERFGERLYVAPSKKTYLEIVHPAVNKGLALAFLADRMGIRKEGVMAIGDSMNDMDMIAYAGFGIAMGNSHAVVKQAADVVTLSNVDDGVAAALEKYVLA